MRYKRVFLDANIFIDMNDESRGAYEKSLAIVEYFVANRVALYTSCDLITTIYYILSKKGRIHALEGIEKLNKICIVIEFSNKEIESTTKLMCENSNFKDLEDTLQYVLAEKSECDLILSNDSNFYSEKIELQTSETLYKKLQL